jgi:hypothetical protein
MERKGAFRGVILVFRCRGVGKSQTVLLLALSRRETGPGHAARQRRRFCANDDDFAAPGNINHLCYRLPPDMICSPCDQPGKIEDGVPRYLL